MRSRKLLLIAGAVVVAGVGGWYLFGRSTQARTSYSFGKVDRGEVAITISATGTLNAVTTVQVGTQVSGTIAKLYADFNSQVKEGDLLAQLDPTNLQATVNEQKANVERAQASFNEAERNIKRMNSLFDKGMISQADIDAATTSLESAKAGMKQAEATLDRAQVNLRYATIKAPISGVVISRDVDVGQTVAASLSAPTIFTIANDLRQMQVEASVDEADIGSVKDGQRVTFRVDAYPDQVFDGTVSQVRLAPIISQNVVTYNVIIDVANPELKLMPGMTATVTIEVAKAENALRLPVQALKFSPSSDVLAMIAEARKVALDRPPQQPGAVASTSDVQDSTSMRSQPHRGGRGGWGQAGDSTQAGTRVWTMENGLPRPVRIAKGIQNSRYVVIEQSRLQEGDSVIVGASTTSGQATTTQTQNPFMPRFPGGGRR
ncbi:MAG: efflux RND transporter periplasmic adaptor subunit [Candidatus Zixiibacteriota bacterium]